MIPNTIILSHPTYVGPSGATAAATHSFFTKNYKPPAQDRSLDFDIVHNQNGKFKYVYDNGPGFKRWETFEITCQDNWTQFLALNAQQQFAALLKFWNFPGIMGMQTPEGTYSIHWAQDPQEQNFIIFPREVGDGIEMDVAVTFEEA